MLAKVPQKTSKILTLEEVQAEIQKSKERIFKLSEDKIDHMQSRKLWYFTPSPKQLAFFDNADKKRRAGFCGNRFGKSTLGVVEDICWLIGYRPFFPEGDVRRTLGIPEHGVKGLVVGEDLDKIKEIFTNNESKDRPGKFIEFLPEGWYTYKKNEKGVIIQINVQSEVNGRVRESVVMFDTVKSFKMSPMGFESGDWDFIHVDEPVMKALWVSASRGLIDRGGFGWWLVTPITEPWMYNEITESAKTDPELFWWFEATMDDNPTLSEEDKKLYIDQLPEDEKEARRLGKPLAHARLVLSHYNEDYHKFTGNLPGWEGSRPPSDSYVICAVDNHPQTPHACILIALNALGDIDIYDELFQKTTIPQYARLVKSKLEGLRVGYVLADPSSWNKDQGSGALSYAEMFHENGLFVVPGSKQKMLALMLAQDIFKQRTRQVRVHARCVNLIREIKHHYFDKENKPVDKDDHLIECLRRLVIHNRLKYYPAAFTNAGQPFTDEPGLEVGNFELDNSPLDLINI